MFDTDLLLLNSLNVTALWMLQADLVGILTSGKILIQPHKVAQNHARNVLHCDNHKADFVGQPEVAFSKFVGSEGIFAVFSPCWKFLIWWAGGQM